MGFATARTISLSGATGHLIDVQVDLAHGVVATALVGRPDASINEARDRCRAAVTNSGFEWPTHPAGDDPAVAGRPAQARLRTSTWPSRSAVLAAAGKVPRPRAGRRWCSSASSPSTAGCGRCPGCCR